MNRIDLLNALLPQTQCGKCGYNGCRPYAEAMLSGIADINQCPPGGKAGITALAAFFGVAPKPLNPAFGQHQAKSIAFIYEEDCIGCVKCINACPVDAIVGAARQMHTVIVSECTGCELCIEPCPVDCIVMKPSVGLEADENTLSGYRMAQSQLARERYEARCHRKEQQQAEDIERRKKQKAELATKLKKR